MNKGLGVAGIALALLLGACGSTGYCVDQNGVCVVTIYEKSYGGFGAFPENMKINTKGGPNVPILVWTFADQRSYEFRTEGSTGAGDGMDLINANAVKVGIRPCFVADQTLQRTNTHVGKYLVCNFVKDALFNETSYRVRFHSIKDNSEKSVDPTVDSSGGGGILDLVAPRPTPAPGAVPAASPASAASAAPSPRITSVAVSRVKVNDKANVDKLGANAAIYLVFNAGNGNLFKPKDYILMTEGSTTYGDCYPSKDPDGNTKDAEGQYFVVVIKSPNAINGKYEGTYTDSANVEKPTKGDVEKPKG